MSQLPVQSTRHPFAASQFAPGRLLWSPLVHEYYHEKCCFFLVRLVNPRAAQRFSLQALIEQSGIKAACVYPIFGQFDFLIRVWATPQKRDRLVRLIEANPHSIDAVREFVARRINYLWVAPDFGNSTGDPELVAKWHSVIGGVCKDVENKQTPNEESLQLLEKAGLIFPAGEDDLDVDSNVENKPPCKVYVALSRAPGPSSVAKIERREIIGLLTRLHAEFGLRQVSLYEGKGFADYLIKGIASDFYSIFRQNAEIVGTVEDFSLRPETYLIAAMDSTESDHLDMHWVEPEGNLLHLEQALGPQYSGDIAKLELTVREEVTKVFVKYRDLLDTPFEQSPFGPTFKGLLAARIRNDIDLLAGAMTVLNRTEGYANALFRQRWIEQFGSDWHRIVREEAQRIGLGKDFDPNKCTFKHCIDISNSLAPVRARITEDLGSGWVDKLAALTRFRNDLAHGEIFAQAGYIVESWDKLARAMCEAGPTYNRLHRMFLKKTKED